MGSTVPNKRLAKVQFYEDHLGALTTNATAVGLSTAECTELGTKTSSARTAYADQQVAIQAAKAATELFHNEVAALGAFGAGLIKKVRARAELTGDLNVYVLAQIPGPATPAPRPAPGKPTNLKVGLDGNGAIELSWKCPNPTGTAGTVYQVWRATGGSADYSFLGAVGSRKFTDATVPAGATRLTYRIQAARSTAVGPWAEFNVNFGIPGGAGGAATVEAVKLAA
ncbi:MAG TPA: hypothetical protein VEA69_25890 [Tepidisphaeraceae bacterium]|nr:hypothetical protein [Tepidisphaeraceae bacterium]